MFVRNITNTYIKTFIMRSFIILIYIFVTSNLFAQSHQIEKKYFINKKIQESTFIDSLFKLGRHQPNNISFLKLNSKNDKYGNSHTKYKQFVEDFPINNAVVILHSQHGYVKKKNGHHYSWIDNIPEHLFGSEVAIDIAKDKFLSYLKEKMSSAEINPTIKIEKVETTYSDINYPNFTNTLIPTYNIHLSDQGNGISHLVIVDASTGLILHTNEKVKHQNIPAKGKSNYYGIVDINLDSISTEKFVFHDNTREATITVNDYYTNDPVETKITNVDFEDPWENAAIDVLYSSGKFYDFMKEKFNFKSLDNNNFPLVANVGRNIYNNAFWNGRNTNFGSGDCHKYSPFTTIDIVGHEFAHGITDFNADLIYQGESGALNESFSDIIGKALEKWAQPAKFSWVLGKPIFRKVSPFRTMNEPHLHNHPSVYKGSNWQNTVFLSFGVHTNSAVSNLWFCMLSDGKKGVNEQGVNYDVKPIGMDKALEIVFHTHINYLSPSSGYFDMYTYSLEATQDLFPGDNEILMAVKEAWKAVGITEALVNQENTKNLFTLNINNLRNGGRLCDKKVDNLEINLNFSGKDPIPANTPINILIYTVSSRISNGSFVSFTDTIINEAYISELSLSSGDKLNFKLAKSLNIDSLLFGINFYAGINYAIGNDEYTHATAPFSLHITKTNAAAKDVFRAGSQKSVIPVDRCNPMLGFSYILYELIGNICDSTDIPFKLLIKNDSDIHEFTIFSPTLSGSLPQIFIRNFEHYFLDSGIKNIENSVLEIYSTIDNVDYLEISDTLNKYFAPFLLPKEVITFDQTIHNSVLVNNCTYCDKSLTNGALQIKTNTFEADLDNCIEPEDYFAIKSESNSNLSSVNVCFNADGIENPILHFDTYLQSSDPFNNMVKLFDGDNYLPNITIYDTDNNMKSYSIPLQQTGKFGLTFGGLLYNSTWRLDNIRLEGVTSVHESIKTSKSFLTNNPANDVLWIKLEDDQIGCNIAIQKITGEVFIADTLRENHNEIHVDNWPSGLYTITIKDKAGSHTKKILIIH